MSIRKVGKEKMTKEMLYEFYPDIPQHMISRAWQVYQRDYSSGEDSSFDRDAFRSCLADCYLGWDDLDEDELDDDSVGRVPCFGMDCSTCRACYQD